jgi:hypothetical protein
MGQQHAHLHTVSSEALRTARKLYLVKERIRLAREPNLADVRIQSLYQRAKVLEPAWEKAMGQVMADLDAMLDIDAAYLYAANAWKRQNTVAKRAWRFLKAAPPPINPSDPNQQNQQQQAASAQNAHAAAADAADDLYFALQGQEGHGAETPKPQASEWLPPPASETQGRLAASAQAGTDSWETWADAGFQQYIGMALQTSNSAGQMSLKSLGLNKTFAYAHPQNMAQDLFGVRGSKVIQNMYGDHMAKLTDIIIKATDPRNPQTLGQTKAAIAKEWANLSKSQVAVIARTETAAVWTATSMNSYAANGITQFESIIAQGPSIGIESEDPCDICVDMAANGPMDIAEDPPPWHPNCRCEAVPVLHNEDGEPWLPPDEPWTGGEEGLQLEVCASEAALSRKAKLLKMGAVIKAAKCLIPAPEPGESFGGDSYKTETAKAELKNEVLDWPASGQAVAAKEAALQMLADGNNLLFRTVRTANGELTGLAAYSMVGDDFIIAGIVSKSGGARRLLYGMGLFAKSEGLGLRLTVDGITPQLAKHAEAQLGFDKGVTGSFLSMDAPGVSKTFVEAPKLAKGEPVTVEPVASPKSPVPDSSSPHKHPEAWLDDSMTLQEKATIIEAKIKRHQFLKEELKVFNPSTNEWIGYKAELDALTKEFDFNYPVGVTIHTTNSLDQAAMILRRIKNEISREERLANPISAEIQEGTAPVDFDEVTMTPGGWQKLKGTQFLSKELTGASAQGLKRGVMTKIADKMKVSGKWDPEAVKDAYGYNESAYGVQGDEGIVAQLVNNWARTSSDSDARALMLQEAAKEEFALSVDSFPAGMMGTSATDLAAAEKLKYDTMEMLARPGVRESLRAFVRAMYETTQEMFAAEGIEAVTVYRGFAVGERVAAEGGGYEVARNPFPNAGLQIVPTTDNPMASWSVRYAQSMKFARGYGRGVHGVMLRAEVPVELIIGTPMTGFGCASEFEMVVLNGGNSTAWAMVEGEQILNAEVAIKTEAQLAKLKLELEKPKMERVEITNRSSEGDWRERNRDLKVVTRPWLDPKGNAKPSEEIGSIKTELDDSGTLAIYRGTTKQFQGYTGMQDARKWIETQHKAWSKKEGFSTISSSKRYEMMSQKSELERQLMLAEQGQGNRTIKVSLGKESDYVSEIKAALPKEAPKPKLKTGETQAATDDVKKISKRIASVRHRMKNPDKFGRSEWSPAEIKDMETKITDLENEKAVIQNSGKAGGEPVSGVDFENPYEFKTGDQGTYVDFYVDGETYASIDSVGGEWEVTMADGSEKRKYFTSVDAAKKYLLEHANLQAIAAETDAVVMESFFVYKPDMVPEPAMKQGIAKGLDTSIDNWHADDETKKLAHKIIAEDLNNGTHNVALVLDEQGELLGLATWTESLVQANVSRMVMETAGDELPIIRKILERTKGTLDGLSRTVYFPDSMAPILEKYNLPQELSADQVKAFLAGEPIVVEDVSSLAAGIKSGWVAGEDMFGGHTAQSVQKAQFKDGTVAVLKEVTAEEADKEYLAWLVAKEVGAPIPEVVELGASGEEMALGVGFVEGKTGTQHMADLKLPKAKEVYNQNEIVPPEATTLEGRKLGIFDILVGNPDRHSLNWIIKDGKPVGIDHGNAFSYARYIDGEIKSKTYGQEVLKGPSSPFTAGMLKQNKFGEITGYGANPLTKADVQLLTNKLELLKPEFEKRGMAKAHEEMMLQLENLGKQAKGTKNIIEATGKPIVPPKPDVPNPKLPKPEPKPFPPETPIESDLKPPPVKATPVPKGYKAKVSGSGEQYVAEFYDPTIGGTETAIKPSKDAAQEWLNTKIAETTGANAEPVVVAQVDSVEAVKKLKKKISNLKFKKNHPEKFKPEDGVTWSATELGEFQSEIWDLEAGVKLHLEGVKVAPVEAEVNLAKAEGVPTMGMADFKKFSEDLTAIMEEDYAASGMTVAEDGGWWNGTCNDVVGAVEELGLLKEGTYDIVMWGQFQQFPGIEGMGHCWIKLKDGSILDPTIGQFFTDGALEPIKLIKPTDELYAHYIEPGSTVKKASVKSRRAMVSTMTQVALTEMRGKGSTALLVNELTVTAEVLDAYPTKLAAVRKRSGLVG